MPATATLAEGVTSQLATLKSTAMRYVISFVLLVLWLSAGAQSDPSAQTMPASPQVGNAERGRALLSIYGPTPRDLAAMPPEELAARALKQRCKEVTQEMQDELDMRAAGSKGRYPLSSLRGWEAANCVDFTQSQNPIPTPNAGGSQVEKSFVVSLSTFSEPGAAAKLIDRLKANHLPAYTENRMKDGLPMVAVRIGPFKARGDAFDARDRAIRIESGLPLVIPHAPLVNVHDMECAQGVECPPAEYAQILAATERRWAITPIKVQMACARNSTIMMLVGCVMKETIASRDQFSAMPWIPGVGDKY